MAESFGSDAEGYDRARPSYHDELIARIVAMSPGPEMLDVGCGTGIAARQLQAAGCRVLGVDPDARMAELARRADVEVEVATFEAWHWVDPATGANKAAQILHPDGRLVVFWNALEPPPALAEAFSDVYRRVETGLPFNPWARPALEGYLAMCTKAADAMRKSGGFGEPEQWRFDRDRTSTRDEWLALVPTLGGHSRVLQGKLDELLTEIGAVIDVRGGSVPVHYVTVAVAARHA